ncbi:MAG: hypothetical protein U0518_05850 [Candidatus Gracilibacteria bacterium]
MAILIDKYDFPFFIVLEHTIPMILIMIASIYCIQKIYVKVVWGRRKASKSYGNQNNTHPSLYHQVAESIMLGEIIPDRTPLYTPPSTKHSSGHSSSS